MEREIQEIWVYMCDKLINIIDIVHLKCVLGTVVNYYLIQMLLFLDHSMLKILGSWSSFREPYVKKLEGENT